MKRFFILLLLFISSVSFLKAAIINQEIAAKAAKNHYFSYSSEIDYNSISLELAFTKTLGEQPVFYIFNVVANKGFIIISAEDNVYPILGYSFEGCYSNQPGFDATNFNYWMNNYAAQIDYVRNNSLEADEFITSTWAGLLKMNPTPKNFDNVDPLLATAWDQGTYYNALCPEWPRRSCLGRMCCHSDGAGYEIPQPP